MAVVSDYTALLSGDSWLADGQVGRGAFVTFSFETSAQPYLSDAGYSANFINSFRAFDATDKSVARDALNQWASSTGLVFLEVPAGQGDIRFGLYNFAYSHSPGAGGFAYYPGCSLSANSAFRSNAGGDVFINTSNGVSLYLLLHEIGHAIGFKHPFDGDPTLTGSLDDRSTTVMSYTGPGSNTLGILDLQAAKYIYGTSDGGHLVSYAWDAVTYTLTQIDGDDADTVVGTAAKDVIKGAGGSDLIAGFEGADQLEGNAGDDTIFGGAGSDTISGGAGSDTLYSSEFSEASGDYADMASYAEATADLTISLSFTSSPGDIFAANGADVGSDTLYYFDNFAGGAGNDTIAGGEYANLIIGNGGADSLSGAGGDDTLVGGSGADQLSGGSGIDTASYLGSAAVSVNLATLAVSGGDAAGDILSSIENLTGSSNADSLTGSSIANIIDGSAGDDLLEGGAGDDQIFGGEGIDTAAFSGVRSDYTITRSGGLLTVTDTRFGRPDGIDTTSKVERFQFKDGILLTGTVGNALPTITSLGGGDVAGVKVNEKMTGVVATILASDADPGAVVTYSIVSAASGGAADGARFFIDSKTGKLAFLSSPNFEAPVDSNLDNVYLVTVQATDEADGYDRQELSVQVGDVNEAPTALTLSNKTGSIMENGPAVKVADVGLADDALGVNVFSLSGVNATSFELRGASPRSRELWFKGGADFETRTTYSVTVQALDSTVAGSHAASAAMTLSIANVDEAPSGAINIASYRINPDGTATISAVHNVTDPDGTVGAVSLQWQANGLGGWADIAGASASTLTVSPNVVGLPLRVLAKYTDGFGQHSLASAQTAYVGDGGSNTLAGGGGADLLLGLGDNDSLDGGLGIDTLAGGKLDDTYVIDSAADRVVELSGEGTDTVWSQVTTTLAANVENFLLLGSEDIAAFGNVLPNRITGNAGSNRLDGSVGNDTLAGGNGSDTYVVDAIGDNIVETNADSVVGGTDLVISSVSVTLGDNIEQVELLGPGGLSAKGNALGNTITGNLAANLLDGGGDADAMAGGGGNDTYVVDDLGDTVTEGLNLGIDKVLSTVSFTLGANVDNLDLLGAANIDGVGNALANTIIGNAGNNLLDGGIDASAAIVDVLKGGKGDDTYIVHTLTDQVTELLNEGTDTVRSDVAYTLGANLENLELQGTAAINGTGNTLDNVLTGNDGANLLNGMTGNDQLLGGVGADTLVGGLGNDTLTGGADADTFVFNSALNAATNVDTILDFAVGIDKISLENGIFSGLTITGPLSVGAFALAADAPVADDRIVYDAATGALFYDKDGSGAALKIQFATLAPGLGLTAGDFLVT